MLPRAERGLTRTEASYYVGQCFSRGVLRPESPQGLSLRHRPMLWRDAALHPTTRLHWLVECVNEAPALSEQGGRGPGGGSFDESLARISGHIKGQSGNSTIPLLGTCPREIKIGVQINIIHDGQSGSNLSARLLVIDKVQHARPVRRCSAVERNEAPTHTDELGNIKHYAVGKKPDARQAEPHSA